MIVLGQGESKGQWLGFYASVSDKDKAYKELQDTMQYAPEIELTDVTEEYEGAAAHYQEYADQEPACVGLVFRQPINKTTGHVI